MDVNLGRIKFVWKGTYSAIVEYEADDIVYYGSSSYIHKGASPTTGTLPTVTATWDIHALGGSGAGDLLADGTIPMTGSFDLGLNNVINAGTYDGRDVSADGTALDTAQTNITNIEAKTDYITVTQAVDLDQLETDVAALANGMVYKDDWNASGGSFPGSGVAQIGWFYNVSVGGTVNGIVFDVGDSIIAKVDNASTGTFAANWVKKDQTDAVQSVVGLIGTITKSALLSALNVEDGADVTDAINVGTSLNGSTAKTTPVDADKVAIIDTEASNVLKHVTWSNIKATLKTYFDTLYAAIGLLSGVNTQTGTTYTLVIGDIGKVVEMNNAAANTLTVPPNSSVAFATNSKIDVAQYGAGLTSIAAGAGVTIRSKDTLLDLGGQYAAVTLYKRATDEWVLIGDLA